MTHTIIELTGSDVDDAADLVSRHIPIVTREGIGRDDDEPAELCRSFIEQLADREAAETWTPRQLWLGAKVDGQLVAALHASPKFPEAAEVCRFIAAGHPQAPPTGWLPRFLNTVTSVEEVAVWSKGRRNGLGRAMLDELHARIRARAARYAEIDEDAGPQSVVAFVAPGAPRELFRNAGYRVGLARQPLPARYMAGLPTTWNPAFDTAPGSYCFRFVNSRPRDSRNS